MSVYACMFVLRLQYVCMHVYVCMCVCMFVKVCMYMYVCMYVCVCVCMHVCIYVCVRVININTVAARERHCLEVRLPPTFIEPSGNGTCCPKSLRHWYIVWGVEGAAPQHVS